jgi:hypothetical protein
VEGLDDACVMLICQANLDTIGGRVVATIEAHTKQPFVEESTTVNSLERCPPYCHGGQC